ncbi:MAG: pyridoxal phosphate-dependent aminotransferase, partial [Ruthenibacterium lactatiformans]
MRPNSAQTEAVMPERWACSWPARPAISASCTKSLRSATRCVVEPGHPAGNRMLYAAGTLCMALLARARCGVPAAGAVTEGGERMELTHGGDWAGYAAQYGGMPLDFSANVSPLGLPQGVRQAVARALDGADRYPDPLCRALRKKLSGTLGVPPQSILCGNGAADLIFRLVLAEKPKRALVTAPTFAEYEQALVVAGCTADRFFLREEEGFAVTEALLERIEPGLDILFLCEPNNPTGRTTPRALLLRILERCAACGTRLVVDECFNEFLDDPAAHTLLGELEGHENLLLLRAFIKWYAMAGVRLDYA